MYVKLSKLMYFQLSQLQDRTNDKIDRLCAEEDVALLQLSDLRRRIEQQKDIRKEIAHLQSALESAQDDFVAEEHYGD